MNSICNLLTSHVNKKVLVLTVDLEKVQGNRRGKERRQRVKERGGLHSWLHGQMVTRRGLTAVCVCVCV